MDKSFNDQELSDIMKEIEALEDDLKVENVSADASAMQEEELDMDPEVIKELAKLDEEIALPTTNLDENPVLSFDKQKVPTPSKGAGANTAMSFKVQGDLNLDLHFEIGGKMVSLEVSQNGLSIQMEGGITFNVPLTDAPSFKKAV
jgi:hypothetical protein